MSRISGRLLAAALLAATAAGAGGPAAAQEQDLREKWALPSYAQLRPLMAPTSRPMPAPITVFVKAHDKTRLGHICRLSPRVRDAVLEVLYRHPIPVRGGKLVLDGVPERLIAPINKALDGPLVDRVYVMQGARSMGEGTVSKLPFGSASGCRGIKKLQEKRNQKAESE